MNGSLCLSGMMTQKNKLNRSDASVRIDLLSPSDPAGKQAWIPVGRLRKFGLVCDISVGYAEKASFLVQ